MSSTVERIVIVNNESGVHFRPADLLSRAAAQFQSTISIIKDGQASDCKSIMEILTLGAAKGAELTLRAEGPDAQAAVDVIVELFNQGFDESDSEVASPR